MLSGTNKEIFRPESRTPFFLFFKAYSNRECILLVSYLIQQLVEAVFKDLTQIIPSSNLCLSALFMPADLSSQFRSLKMLYSSLVCFSPVHVQSFFQSLMWSGLSYVDLKVLLCCVHLHFIFYWNKEIFRLLLKLLFLYNSILRNK